MNVNSLRYVNIDLVGSFKVAVAVGVILGKRKNGLGQGTKAIVCFFGLVSIAEWGPVIPGREAT